MKRILIALVLLSLISELSDAQRIRVRRIVQAQADTAGTGDFLLGEPLLTTDTYRFYVGTQTGVVRVGLDSLGRLDLDSVYARTTSDGAANLHIASDGAVYRTTDTNAVLPSQVFKQVPSDVFGLTTSSYTSTLNDTITVCAVVLPHAITLGSAWVATGTLTGSSTRTFSIGVYSSAGARLDTTAATAWPGNGTGGVAAFGIGASVGPGLVYVAFSTNAGSGVTMQYRAPDFSSNSIFSGIVSGQNATYPLVGYATTKLSSGSGWPATITIAKSTTTTVYPYIMLVGSAVD